MVNKLILTVAMATMAFLPAGAGEGDRLFTVNAGFLFNSTLHATVGWERELAYGNAVEFSAEAGNRWRRDPICGKVCSDVFWKGYYWDGAATYKKCARRYKNAMLRIAVGAQCGAVTRDWFLGVQAGLEYVHVTKSGIHLSVQQRNYVNFIHGDSFRNGLTVGIKIPL